MQQVPARRDTQTFRQMKEGSSSLADITSVCVCAGLFRSNATTTFSSLAAVQYSCTAQKQRRRNNRPPRPPASVCGNSRLHASQRSWPTSAQHTSKPPQARPISNHLATNTRTQMRVSVKVSTHAGALLHDDRLSKGMQVHHCRGWLPLSLPLTRTRHVHKQQLPVFATRATVLAHPTYHNRHTCHLHALLEGDRKVYAQTQCSTASQYNLSTFSGVQHMPQQHRLRWCRACFRPLTCNLAARPTGTSGE